MSCEAKAEPGIGGTKTSREHQPKMPRVTISSLMIAIGLFAGVLALYQASGPASVIFAILTLAIGLFIWLVVREYPPLAPWMFSVSNFIGTVPMAFLCVYCYDYPIEALLYLSGIVTTGLGLGSGLVWISGGKDRHRLARPFVQLVVIGGLMPLSMAIAPWPLYIAFAISRPSMERIADRVAAGDVLKTPGWAGVFWVVGAEREPSNGVVALLIDDNPSSRAGFVRLDDEQKLFGPLHGLSCSVSVGHPWRYQVED